MDWWPCRFMDYGNINHVSTMAHVKVIKYRNQLFSFVAKYLKTTNTQHNGPLIPRNEAQDGSRFPLLNITCLRYSTKSKSHGIWTECEFTKNGARILSHQFTMYLLCCRSSKTLLFCWKRWSVLLGSMGRAGTSRNRWVYLEIRCLKAQWLINICKMVSIFRHACMGLSQILEHHHALQSLVFLTNMLVDWDITHFENKHNEQNTSLQVTRPLQRAMYWMISYGCSIVTDRVLFETFWNVCSCISCFANKT